MTGEDVIFLAHFTGWALPVIQELEPNELFYWCNEAKKLHNKLNSSDDA